MQIMGDLIRQVVAFAQATNPEDRSRAQAAISKLMGDADWPTPLEAAVPLPGTQQVLAGRDYPLRHLSDDALAEINALLPWGGMTADLDGRSFGRFWSGEKRSNQQPLIDKRLQRFDARYPLKGAHVLEVGCFEGIHTIGALSLGARVTAIDGRVENILKTLVRLWAYGYSADVQLWDFEQAESPTTVPASWDILHHVGVLYHLTDPAGHLAALADRTERAVILDTHVAGGRFPTTKAYEALGRSIPYAFQAEDIVSPFAGLRDHAKWLEGSELERILTDRGFKITLSELREERNGHRIMIWAER